MEKKGDVTITTIILIVLGLVVLVFLIVGSTKGFDFIFGKFDTAPGQALETVAQSCILAAQADLLVDFCSFKEVSIDGKNNFINCKDSRVDASLRNAGIDLEKSSLGCENYEVLNNCVEVAESKRDSTYVEGGVKTCENVMSGLGPCSADGAEPKVCECGGAETEVYCKIGQTCDVSGDEPVCNFA
ncbi:MAG: hypothetical protein Q8P57_02240 [Candidatus Pacearchaeota archaeon]|nr:hypothetical protein [Candidatus Pacearchaeota archaeon]